MLLKGKPVADKIKEYIVNSVKIMEEEKGIRPKLAILRLGDNPDDIAYENRIIKNCSAVGISAEVKVLKADADMDSLMEALETLNKAADINGILVFRPLPPQIDIDKVSETIKAEKDVDGMSPVNMAKLFNGDERAMAPCTAEAVVEMLKHYYGDISGKNVVIVNRSMVLGKPLSMLLLKENATVTLSHSKTINMKEITSRADIVVSGIGKGKFFGAEYFSQDSIVIDVGINFVNDEMCGDVDFESAESKVAAITPVPGGIGIVTSMVLLRNVIKGMSL